MKVLGLDLGVASIGWSLIEVDEKFNPIEILGIGSRIVPLNKSEPTDFAGGKGITRNAERTMQRTMRKGYDRFSMRRDHLRNRLTSLGMYDAGNTLDDLPPMELWGLRAKAATVGNRLSPEELGRVLLHLNQKRGYRHAKDSTDSESKDTAYVEAINNRYKALKEENLTIGQKMYDILKESAVVTKNGKTVVTGRIKEGDPYSESNLLPRQAHIEEYDKIMEVQSAYHPDLLTPEIINELRHIIFFQRPLKSCKHLVSDCEFIRYKIADENGVIKEYGPKVAPVSSPISQETRIWEAVNNLHLVNKSRKASRKRANADVPSLFDEGLPEGIISREARLLGREYHLSDEERLRVVEYLRKNEKLTASKLLEILGLKKSDGFTPNINLGTSGIKGNLTYVRIGQVLEDFPGYDHLLRFDLKEWDKVNTKTGEIYPEVSDDCYEEPLYKLWHILYSLSERKDVANALERHFNISDSDLVDRLFALDFKSAGFSNRSAKFMRRLLPFLRKGMKYSEACECVGVRHSDYETAEENKVKVLKTSIERLRKGELRQPVVEKVLNQMINIINELTEKYGEIDEIHIELARELKQSKERRAQATKDISLREKDNLRIAKLIEQHGETATRKRIQKYRMWEEAGGRCVYCGKSINVKSFLSGDDSEVEHIVPRSILFDDSFSNKTLACRKCNDEKNNRTAFDFMSSKPEKQFEEYLARVKEMAENPVKNLRISRTKYSRFLMPESELPENFLNRDLNATQYISRKAMELAKEICRNVHASSGIVTDYFRHIWGYDRILEQLNLDRYAGAGLVDRVELEHKGQCHVEKRIRDWSKRLDHRHHAIDALTVALTRPGYIQRLSNLNTERGFLKEDIETEGVDFRSSHSLVEQWAESRPHFSVNRVSEAVDGIAVSFKAGNRAVTPGRKVLRKDGTIVRESLVPRGAMHEASIYGKTYVSIGEKPLKYCLQNPEMIVNREIREKITDLLKKHDNDIKKASAWIKKNPLACDDSGNTVTKFECVEPRMTIRYKLAAINSKNVDTIVDPVLKEIIMRRLDVTGEKGFARSLEDSPITMPGSPRAIIKSVKCYAKLKEESTVAVKHSNGRPVGFAKKGNNHHVALYETPEGNIEAPVTSMWMAVKRRQLGLSEIIRRTDEVWDKVCDMPESEVLTEVVSELPNTQWKFKFSLRLNEMFVLGLSEDEWRDAITSSDRKTLANHLYRVQTLTPGDFRFRFHKDIASEFNQTQYALKHAIICASMKSLLALNPHKVRISPAGEIVPVDD